MKDNLCVIQEIKQFVLYIGIKLACTLQLLEIEESTEDLPIRMIHRKQARGQPLMTGAIRRRAALLTFAGNHPSSKADIELLRCGVMFLGNALD